MKTKSTKPKAQRVQECAAQHFGPWMVEPQWFCQAVDAVKAGTFRPARPAVRSETVRDDSTGYRLYEVDRGVARISIAGQITKGESSFGGASSIRTRKAVRKAVSDDRVTSILLHIDSPGGTVAGTDDLARDVAAADKKKPVYAFYEDLCASAALWVGSQARKSFANATARVGSIGTVAVVVDSSGAADKAGLKVHVVSTGPFKGAFTPGTEISDEQLADLRREVEGLNEHFLAGVSAGRKMPLEKVRKLATGQVWLASEAKQLGLIDEVASLDAAVQAITQEVSRMTAEQFTAYAAEHPEAPEVKALFAKGHKAGKAEGLTESKNTLKAIDAAVPNKPRFAIDQFLAGHDADAAKANADAVNRETVALNEQIAAQAKEIEKLKAEKGTQGAVATAVIAKDAAVSSTTPETKQKPEEQAKAEWAENFEECRSSFSSEKNYIAYRSREIAGQIKPQVRVRSK